MLKNLRCPFLTNQSQFLVFFKASSVGFQKMSSIFCYTFALKSLDLSLVTYLGSITFYLFPFFSKTWKLCLVNKLYIFTQKAKFVLVCVLPTFYTFCFMKVLFLRNLILQRSIYFVQSLFCLLTWNLEHYQRAPKMNCSYQCLTFFLYFQFFKWLFILEMLYS